MNGRKTINPESRRTSIAISIAAICIVVSMAAVFMFFRPFGTGNTNTQYRERFNDYNDGWTLIIDGQRETVDLPTKVHSGEDNLIILRKTLPNTIASYSAIATRNYHQIMTVKVGDEELFTYPGQDTRGAWSLISDEWSVINLEKRHAGQILEITLRDVGIPRFAGTISDIYFGDDNSLIDHIKSMTIWDFTAGAILILFGFIIFGISLIYRKFTNQAPNTPMGGVLLFFGIWLCNRAKMPLAGTNNDRFFYISVLAMLFVGPLIFLYSHYRNDFWKKESLIEFRVSGSIALILAVTMLFIPYNIQYVMALAYFLCLSAIVLQAIALYKVSFGERAKVRSNIALALDRYEFFTTIIFPLSGILEMVLFSNQLWTEISVLYRLVIVYYAIMYMVTILWRTYLVVRDRSLVTERLQESQMELMMGQIQPHFIFNTLSSIRTLVRVDPDIAYQMLYDFSNYLRANVDNVTNMDGIPFSSEVEHIKSYVNIESVRFGDRLNVEYDIGPKEFIVPPLSIQPLVENAIKHGVCQKLEGGTVWLRSYEEPNCYVVEIDDDGIGFDQEAASAMMALYEEDDNKVGMESNAVATKIIQDLMQHMKLKDENGDPIKLGGPVKRQDLSGNGSESHKSSGMRNIFLRLREMTDADIDIESQVGKGTKIKVSFPKNELNANLEERNN